MIKLFAVRWTLQPSERLAARSMATPENLLLDNGGADAERGPGECPSPSVV
jgi:hypothetical protein